MFIFALILTIGLAYLIGSVSPGYLAGELLQGIDLRQQGSGKLGASNVLRALGKGPGIIVLLLDILKGFLTVWMGKGLAGYFNLGPDYIVILEVTAGLAVILGHIYTCFLGFKGGKGVATGLGVFLFLAPGAIGGALVVFMVTVFSTGYISLGSMLAAVSLPIFLWGKSCFGHCAQQVSPWIISLAALIALVVVFKHVSNIQRILAGCENKFSWGEKKDN